VAQRVKGRRTTTSAKQNKRISPRERAKELPGNLQRDGYIYIRGVIEKAAHGTYHLTLDNEMPCLATARKLDNFFHVSLMEGDLVYVEIDPLNLSNDEVVKGRIIWRVP
jgi:translation initiation factor IF-1